MNKKKSNEHIYYWSCMMPGNGIWINNESQKQIKLINTKTIQAQTHTHIHRETKIV